MPAPAFRELTAHFLLAYALTWGGVALVVASGAGTLWLGLPMLAGPPLSAVLLTLRAGGRSALLALTVGFLHWRAHPLWYVLALGLAPALCLLAIALASVIAGPAYRPGLSLALLPLGFLAGLAEEIGWTGYATPRLLSHLTWPVAGAILGVVWALWHMAADLAGNLGNMGWLWPLWFGVFWLAALPPYRMLMTLAQQRTRAPLLGVLMHASYTGWLLCLSPALTVAEGLLWQSLFALLMWVAAGLAIRWNEGARRRRT